MGMGVSTVTQEVFDYHQITSSTNVCPVSGALGGIFVSAASATPTITVYDSATTGTSVTIVSIFTPTAGTYYKLPFYFSTGCYVVISGTVSCTVGTVGRY